MVIKVDFDLTMSILAHNLYRLLAFELTGYEDHESSVLYEKFIYNNGMVKINKNINIFMKKKRNLPAILSAMKKHHEIKIPWIKNKALKIFGASSS